MGANAEDAPLADCSKPGMRRFLKLSTGFYLLAISLGLLLRVSYVHGVGGLDFGHALHAHSHTLYYGWAGLSLCTLWLMHARATGRLERIALWVLVALSAGTFAAFLHSGYGGPGIAASAAALVVWSGLAVLLWRATARTEGRVRSVLRLAVIYLGLGLCGAAARAALVAVQPAHPLYGGLAVFAFVHDFAWFLFLGASALLVASADKLGLRFDPRWVRASLGTVSAFAWLTFPLGVAGAQSGVLGLVARLAAVGVAVGMALWAITVWRAARGSLWARGVAIWSACHAAGSLAGVWGVAPLATAVRHPLIIYLHVFLVGVVTTTLLALVAHTLDRRPVRAWLHHGGLAVMLAGLALASVPAFAPWTGLRLGAITAGLWIALAGALGLVLAAADFVLNRASVSAATGAAIRDG